MASTNQVNVINNSSPNQWRRYSAYKDSGIEWLGEIPRHWEVKRLKFVVNINPGKSEISHLPLNTTVSFFPMERIGENGSLDMEESRTLEQVRQGYTYFRNDDVILAKITPCFENGKGALCANLLDGIGFGTTELHVIRATKRMNPQYVFYLTRTYLFREAAIATMYGAAGQQRVSEDFIKNFGTAIPPLAEQKAIASFLDKETERIDDLVGKKELLLELLKEKRTALISHAVTKGLDATVAMKDSGIEWLGEIPRHWEVKRLKFLTSFVTSGSRGWAKYYSDKGAMFIRIANLFRTSIELDLADIQCVLPPQGAEGERTRVRGKDVLVSITAYIGSVAVVPDGFPEAYVSQHIALTRPRQQLIESKWLAHYFTSSTGQTQFGLLLYGGTKDGLGLNDIKNLFVVLPPLAEQKAIASYLDKETLKLDNLIKKIRESIERQKEYRTALISAAVTGKIDVSKN